MPKALLVIQQILDCTVLTLLQVKDDKLLCILFIKQACLYISIAHYVVPMFCKDFWLTNTVYCVKIKSIF